MIAHVAVTLLALGPSLPVTEEEEVERATDWPELSGREEKQIETEIQRLRKARTGEMAVDAHETLAATGAGAAPLLLRALGKEEDEAARERVVATLEAITGPEHTRLLGREFDHESSRVRVWCLERCARHPDAALVEPARDALAAVEERIARKSTKERVRERFAAAVCVTSAGGLDGLDALFETASETKRWARHGVLIRIASESVRGPEASRAIVAKTAGEREAIVGGLRLLAGLGDDSAKPTVREHLGSSDNSIRVAAINAARGIVDGDPPVDRLPVFEAVELAKRWQQRL